MTTTGTASRSAMVNDWQYQELVALGQRADIPKTKLTPILETLWPVYHGYDTRAEKSQRQFRAGAVAVYCLSGLAVAVAIGQLLFMPAAHSVVVLEVLAMVAALSLLTLSHRCHWKRQWLTTRYTAEQLRMRMYLAIVLPQGDTPSGHGSAVDPSKTLPYYNQLGATLPADAESAIRESRSANCTVEDAAALKTWLGKGWIANQVRFHKEAASRHRRASRRARITTLVLFAITLVAAMFHALGIDHRVLPDGHLQSLAANLIVFLSIALPAVASAVHAISDLLDHERIAARSDGMANILGLLAAEADEAQTLEQIRDLARRTEQVMAIESFEWLAALTFRQPPHTPA